MLLFVSVSLFINPADAAIQEDLGVSPKAMSLGNAVTADPPGIYAIHFNPAGLTDLRGVQSQMSIISPWLSHEAKFEAPDDFGIFGFNDDPVKGRTSKTSRAAVLPPFTDNMISVSQGTPAPTAAGISYSPPNSSLTFATAIYPQGAGGIDRDQDNDPGRFGGRKSAGGRITYFSPTVAYEYTDTLSLGLSFGLNFVNAASKADLRAPNPLVGLARTIDEDICPALSGFGSVGLWFFGAGCAAGGIGPFEKAASIDAHLQDSMVPHFNLGIQWTPAEWIGFGLTYRSQAEAEMSGEFTLDFSQEFENLVDTLNQGPLFQAVFRALQLPRRGLDKQTGQITTDFTFPEHIKAGTFVKPTSNLQVNFDVGWTNWDRVDNVTVEFNDTNQLLRFGRLLTGQGLTELNLPRGYKSEIYWGTGVMYDVNEFHQLRLGFENRESSIPNDKIGPFAPLPDAELYGFGWGYQWSRRTFLDFSLSHLRAAVTVPPDGSTNLNSTGVGNLIFNPFAGLKVSFDTTATLGALTIRHKF